MLRIKVFYKLTLKSNWTPLKEEGKKKRVIEREGDRWSELECLLEKYIYFEVCVNLYQTHMELLKKRSHLLPYQSASPVQQKARMFCDAILIYFILLNAIAFC